MFASHGYIFDRSSVTIIFSLSKHYRYERFDPKDGNLWLLLSSDLDLDVKTYPPIHTRKNLRSISNQKKFFVRGRAQVFPMDSTFADGDLCSLRKASATTT